MTSPVLGVFQRKNLTFFGGKIITSTTGAIAATSDQPVDLGCIVTRTGVGRYKVQLQSKFRQFLGAMVSVVGPDTAAYGVAAIDCFIRQDKVGTNTPDGSFLIQFMAVASNNDAELADGYSFFFLGVVAQ